ncbi:hypothetical protein E2C01_036792 [Portunus trituberculatus]|uniref:Uncharacterized protein n=1 Tax=Portunus trituberculatus TaxID=210409 RepID=A0A5B7FFA7_PORTR|nr:hypothetical protein [Portunus trituberculatus]
MDVLDMNERHSEHASTLILATSTECESIVNSNERQYSRRHHAAHNNAPGRRGVEADYREKARGGEGKGEGEHGGCRLAGNPKQLIDSETFGVFKTPECVRLLAQENMCLVVRVLLLSASNGRDNDVPHFLSPATRPQPAGLSGTSRRPVLALSGRFKCPA